MKRLVPVLAALAIWGALGAIAWAAEAPIGTVVGTADGGTITNGTTAFPFAVPFGSKVSIQCDNACYVEVGRDGRLVRSVKDLYQYDGGCTGALGGDGGPRCWDIISYEPVTLTNVASDAGVFLAAGTYLAQYQLFPTATPNVGAGPPARYTDAGVVAGSSIVRVRCASAACNANVFTRSGNE